MKVSGFDRFLMALAPEWGINRLRARWVAENLARHYEAAEPGRRTSGWQRNFADADQNVRWQIVQLRAISRDLMRNNGWAKNAQRVVADNTVGWGIKAKATGPAAARASDLWKRWAETTECESEGRHTFYGLQHLAMKSIVESGEVLFRRRWRKAKDNLTLPFQIQVLEADYLDHARTTLETASTGPTVQGIQFDKIGRRVGYWLYERHPGSGRNFTPAKLVPAEDVIHVYYTERPGQSRGVSWLASSILKIKDFDEYEDAELMRQKIAACFAAFVTDLDGQGALIGAAGPPDGSADALAQTFEPGMIEHLPPGKDIKFGAPPPVTEGGFSTRTLRRIAAAIGVTYEDLTGDYSQVNFSSARLARIAHFQHVQDWRWNMLVPLFCDGVWKWVVEAAQIAGELPRDIEVPVKWVAPPMPMIEPDKEGLALSRMVRGGFKTLSQAILEQGEDPEDHLKAYAADLKTVDALGIVLDSDPRKMTQAGQEQPSETAEKAPEPEEPDASPGAAPPKPGAKPAGKPKPS